MQMTYSSFYALQATCSSSPILRIEIWLNDSEITIELKDNQVLYNPLCLLWPPSIQEFFKDNYFSLRITYTKGRPKIENTQAGTIIYTSTV